MDHEKRRGGQARGVLVFIVASVVMLFAAPLPAAETGAGGRGAGEQKGFILHLVGRGEYSLARRELYRMRSIYPDALTPDGFILAEDHILFGQGRFAEIIDRATGPALCSIYRFDALYRTGRLEQASALARSGRAEGESLYGTMMARRAFAIDLLNGIYTPSPANTGLSAGELDSLKVMARVSREGLKNSWMGGSLSLIPGGGYMYAGDVKTGIVALLVISVTTALTVLAFQTDNRAAGTVFGAVTVFFYGGSIIGGYRESLRTNNRIREQLAAELEKKLDFAGDRERLFSGTGMVENNDGE